MENFWKVAISIGGLAAIGAFVFWSLYKDWLRLPIFSQLNSDQTFKLMLIFLSLTFLSLASLLGAYVWVKSYDKHPKQDSITISNNTFPATDRERKTIQEAIDFLQIKLTILNEIFSYFNNAFNMAQEYVNEANPTEYKQVVNYVEFAQGKITNLVKNNHPLPDYLLNSIVDTPLSVENIGVLYGYVNLEADDKHERLNFMVKLLNPEMPFDNVIRKKWILTTREAHRQGVTILSNAICEFLLPIEHNFLVDFRKGFLPKLTAFENANFNFGLDLTQLQQNQKVAENKRNAYGDELSKMLGILNVDAQLLDDYVKDMKTRVREKYDKSSQ